MPLYQLCKEIADRSLSPDPAKNGTALSRKVPVSSTVPDLVRKNASKRLPSVSVFYISDLHLESHIVNTFGEDATDDDVRTYVNTVARSLFQGEFEEAVREFEWPIVFFGGDVAASFPIAELFYRAFAKRWKEIELEEYQAEKKRVAEMKKARAELQAELTAWREKHVALWPEGAAFEDCSGIPEKIIKKHIQYKEISDQVRLLPGRKQNLIRMQGVLQKTQRQRSCYIVLGNHEYWDFSSAENCVSAYRKLTDTLGLILLDSQYLILGDYRRYLEKPFNELTDDSDEFDAEYYFYPGFLKVVLLGGVGYAVNNASFSAADGIYLSAIDEPTEVALHEQWICAFRNAKQFAKAHSSILVVLSHMPPSDWLPKGENIDNCVFFHGHTHRNMTYGDDQSRFVFADNQVGYTSKRFSFRKIRLYKPRNPFTSLPDGLHEATTSDYRDLYRYLADDIPGTKLIENTLAKGGKFYVVREAEYFGFFGTYKKSVYICNGGRLIKLPPQEDGLSYYTKNFSQMVSLFLRSLSPLRAAQEKLSDLVKSFGGDGRIHGTIVDIDFLNHIMIDTYDGSLNFYYSPMFGAVKRYGNLQGLLHEQCPKYEKRYLGLSTDKQLPNTTVSNTGLVFVDIKNSPYRISGEIQALQRLFSGHILRDWNDEALQRALFTPDSRISTEKRRG